MFADVCCAGYYIVKYHDMNRTALIDQIKQTRAALDITSPNAFGINKEAELWNGTMFLRRKERQDRTPKQARRVAAACQNVWMEQGAAKLG